MSQLISIYLKQYQAENVTESNRMKKSNNKNYNEAKHDKNKPN